MVIYIGSCESRSDTAGNPISNVADEHKINAEKREQSGKWGKKELGVTVKVQHEGPLWGGNYAGSWLWWWKVNQREQ